ncbi:MAG: hypothetical protein WCF68_21365 [Terriglobales bacterium]
MFLRPAAAATAVLFVASLLAPLAAQASEREKPKPYALIFGTVWDPEGHPLYGVHVNIRRADDKPKKVRWEIYSNHTGEFAQRVPVGKADYIVWADVKGYKLPSGKKLKPGTEVSAHIDNDERCDVGLHLDW